MGITYLKGDATQPVTNGTNVIVHICNNLGAWGAGFVLAISNRWKKPELEYRNLEYYKMGEITIIYVEKNTHVVNMIAQNGIGYSKKCRVSYDDLRLCLRKVYNGIKLFENVKIHMPRIGCGLGGGKWSIVEQIIIEELLEIPVYVYDFE